MSTEKETPTLLSQDVIPELNDSKSQERNSLNNSATSDDNYAKIKDMLLKKQNLDLSPVFVYAKKTLIQKQLEDEVKSKFFESKATDQQNVIKNKDDYNESKDLESDKNKPNTYTCEDVICTSNNYNNTSSPKIRDMELPVSGFLFNHGAEGIPDSLNVSINTTGFEDNEDFPHCIDSSLLMSPKANIPATTECSNSNEVLSQEVPNFLTGFRKTGISFFGVSGSTPSENQLDSGAVRQTGGFSFTFANDEKKGRGGLFSMFH